MKKALQIYGSLRNFDFCLPKILKFIQYNPDDFDVFLLIDDTNHDVWPLRHHNDTTAEYTHKKIEILTKILLNNITSINYVSNFSVFDLEKEQNAKNDYFSISGLVSEKSKKSIETHDFVRQLHYRRNWINEHRIKYENKNKIQYDWIIRTRFDVSTLKNVTYFDYQNQDPSIMHMCGDIMSISSSENINLESSIDTHYPFLANLYINEEKTNDNGKKILQKFYEHYDFSKWITMPEANLILYLDYHNIKISGLPFFINREYN
jgi:hypothetical protein